MSPTHFTSFVDSANQAEAERWLHTGLATGVTTNPTILRRAGLGVRHVPEIADWAKVAGAKEVCFQTWGGSATELYDNAQRLLDLAPDATIKVPCTELGAEVATRLQEQGTPILLTAGYSPKQVLIASALGVPYFAPYFNRIRHNGRDALAELETMVNLVPQVEGAPQIMAASIKSAADVTALARVGIRTFTLSPEVLEELMQDTLTDVAVLAFEDDMKALH
jgi:TalC/MipB family fructose-6-phosphate aldolase